MLEDDVIYEIEALQSIYAEDFEERPEVWGYPSFAIKVKPQAEDGVTCCVTLVVTLNKLYPKIVPRCELVDVKGLVPNELAELKASIAKNAERNIGEVMIHDIVSHIETYLYAHNKNPANTKTFYEKMQTRKKLEETALDDLRSGRVLGDDIDDLDSEAGERRDRQRDRGGRSDKRSSGGQEAGTGSTTQGLTDEQMLDGELNLRGRLHSGERSVSLGSSMEEDNKASSFTNSLKKSWDVENKNEFDESISEGGETWLTELLKHKISENLMEYDDDLDDDDEEHEHQQQQQQLLLQQQQKQQGVEGGSRYHKEFQEIHLLGKGGGGEVWKVKNNLDRRAYAVKKILLNPTDKASNNRIRREVTTISSLLHKHIVRYYAAWVEKLTIPVVSDEDDLLDVEKGGLSSSRIYGGSSDRLQNNSDLDLSSSPGLGVSDDRREEKEGEDAVSGLRKATTSTTIMNFR